MSFEQLFRLAENKHLPILLTFDPGSERGKPRGYTVTIAGASSGIHQRIEEAVVASIGATFGLLAQLEDRLESQRGAKDGHP